MSDLSSPHAVQARLEEIETDLSELQNEYEQAALKHFRMKRDREKLRALTFIKTTGTVAERNAVAESETAVVGRDEEAVFEACKAVHRVLDTRAAIGMSILRSQGRV